MPPGVQSNRLIGFMPAAERSGLLHRCVEARLRFGEVLAEPNQPIRHVYFPCTGFVSLVATVDGHTSLEVGLVGAEGMFGVPLALGQSISPLRSLVQGEGAALRIAVEDFRAVFAVSPGLRRVLFSYLHVQVSQIAQVAVCTRFHVVERRLARWVLMTHDRARDDEFRITHELIADMLGVRRAGVSTAAASLQERGLIRYQRGHMTVLDRRGLEKASCECYAISEGIYRRTLG